MKITVNKLNYLLARHLDKQGEEMNIEKVEKDIKEILEGGLISEGEDGVYGIDNSSLSDADEKIEELARDITDYLDKELKGI